jgi:hypothetical protein
MGKMPNGKTFILEIRVLVASSLYSVLNNLHLRFTDSLNVQIDETPGFIESLNEMNSILQFF